MQNINTVIETFSKINGLSEDTYRIFNEHKDILLSWKKNLVDTFYEKLFSYEKTANIPNEGEREKLENTLSNWYVDIIDGNIDDNFWKKQWYIGLAHIARGVDNSYMISMMNILQSEFAKKCFAEFEADKALELSLAFNKITDAILSVIVEGYIHLYIEAIERMSGIKREVVNRMASLESKKMFKEYKDNI